MGIPTMFACSLELYELQTWGAAGDGGFHLDNHTGGANLLSHQLVHIHGGAGSGRASPSRVTSPTSSVAQHLSTSSPARSHSRTPPHGTSLVRSHSHSASSTSSHTAPPESPAGSTGEGHEFPPESPAGSTGEGHEFSESTSQDGDGTDKESTADPNDEVPGDDEHQASESFHNTSSSSNVEEVEKSDGKAEGSTSQSSQSSSESDGEMPVHATTPLRETGKDTATKEAKTSVPSSSKLLLDADSKATEAEWKRQ